MTAWETNFTLMELLDLRFWAKANQDKDLIAKLTKMIDCLGQCESNQILVTLTQK